MNNPELYTKSNPTQMRDSSQVLDVYKEKLDPNNNDKILDIGCGTGDVTLKVLAPSIGKFEVLFGVDISRDMIQYARLHNGTERIQYEELDIASDVTSFREQWGTFSKIFSFFCLHWVKDLKKALDNIRSLMKPGGECLLVFVAHSAVFDMYKRMAKNSKWEGYMLDVNDYIPDTQNMDKPSLVFSQMMEEAGIKPIEIETQYKSFPFASPKDLRDTVVVINPFVGKIPPSLKDEFIDESIKILEEIKQERGIASKDESCFSYTILVVHGGGN